MKLKELGEKAKEKLEKEEEIKLRNNINLQKIKRITTRKDFEKNNKKYNIDIKKD